MTEIRIRTTAEAGSAHLADLPFDQIDTVIPALKSWGVLDTSTGGEPNDLVGQFIYDPGTNTAYFEIVMNNEGADA